MLQKYLSAMLFILLHLRGEAAHSQTYEIDTTSIREVVNKWNEAHNQIDEEAFSELYAPTVLFYANYLPKKTCLEKKLSLLHKQPFEQHLASDLHLTFYEDGIVYCGFTKEVTEGKATKSYPSYLLLRRFGDRYLITGESDLITDRKLKFHPSFGVQIPVSELLNTDLNEPAHQPDYLTLFLVVGPMIIAILVVVIPFNSLFKRNTRAEPEKENTSDIRLPGKQERHLHSMFSMTRSEELRQSDLKKGHTFEEFVVNRFREKSDCFKWIDATSDKGTRGYFPESNMNPDLQYEYRIGGERYPFSVECKFRSAISGQVNLTKDGQLERYRRFGMEKGMEVFIVLGLGGTPRKPKELFVIPIEDAKQVMDKKSLAAFKAQPSFYYSVNERRLY